MDYLEFKIKCLEEFQEILIAELAEIGFDSFLENEDGIDAYILQSEFDRKKFTEIISKYQQAGQITLTEGVMPKVNWNEEWEKNYDPIEVENLVYVRASFHESKPGFRHEIVINPKMSFGTGHHATTYQMLRHQGELDHTGKRVLDVGSGTGILAIMAQLLGASQVEAFDIDDWCVDNGNENFDLNGLTTRMGLGTIRQVNPLGPFEIILANINKNVLLDELEIYAGLLAPEGFLLLSGFYTEDIEDLLNATTPLGLVLRKKSAKDNWAALILQKIDVP
ncbi:50S ribosomal protein L11 methyltransferase [Algoriphagus boritolerans]|nr:50S ribosomal protein L11 methyltransferase [Algoriphagus boritolerans]